MSALGFRNCDYLSVRCFLGELLNLTHHIRILFAFSPALFIRLIELLILRFWTLSIAFLIACLFFSTVAAVVTPSTAKDEAVEAAEPAAPIKARWGGINFSKKNTTTFVAFVS